MNNKFGKQNNLEDLNRDPARDSPWGAIIMGFILLGLAGCMIVAMSRL